MSEQVRGTSAAAGPPVEVVAGIVIENGRVLVTRRPEGQMFAGRWELPGGKMEPGETPAEALRREFEEELGVPVLARAEFGEVSYRNPAGLDVRVRFYLGDLCGERPRPLEVAEIVWADPARLRELDFMPSNRTIVARLAEDLERRRGGGRRKRSGS